MKYTGNKNFPGVIEFLVNHLPKSERYFSLFFGGGGLETCKYTSGAKFICSEKNKECIKYQNDTAVIEFLDYKDLIDNFVFDGQDFVFADPPYTLNTRRSSRKYYKFEFEENDHIDFLNIIKPIEAKIMITHPACELYNEELKKWKKIPFEYQTRKGIFKDCLWLNYSPEDIVLLNYDVLGNNFTERQAIKRQRKNIVNKFQKLDIHIRRKILLELHHIKNN